MCRWHTACQHDRDYTDIFCTTQQLPQAVPAAPAAPEAPVAPEDDAECGKEDVELFKEAVAKGVPTRGVHVHTVQHIANKTNLGLRLWQTTAKGTSMKMASVCWSKKPLDVHTIVRYQHFVAGVSLLGCAQCALIA